VVPGQKLVIIVELVLAGNWWRQLRGNGMGGGQIMGEVWGMM